MPNPINQLAATLIPVIEVLERLQVPYYIGGSVASMTHGEKRETSDVDLVADLAEAHIPELVAALSGQYYVDEEMIRRDIRGQRNFNVIHLEAMYKVDVFPLKSRPYDRQALDRRQQENVPTEPPVEAYVAQPEDIVLAKLEWFRLGGETSDRQWRDILGVLKLQSFNLDFGYMEKWAREIEVHDLLERALDDAGLNEKPD
jgi:hypothetical protein